MQAIASVRSNRAVWLGLVVAMLACTAGCGVDSWLDPSVTGRWEGTPVTLPILDRLDIIDEPEEAIPGLSQITSADLVPQVTEYVLGPGDPIEVGVFELVRPEVQSTYQRTIDELGFIRLPFVGQVKAAGLTTKQLEQQVIDILHPNILRDPTVSVTALDQRQNTYSVIGAAGAVGTYVLPKTNFRLLDAIAQSRGIPAEVETLYVIRHVPLVDVVEGEQYDREAEPGEYRPPLQPSERDTGQPGTDAGDGGGNGQLDTGSLLEQLSEGIEGGAETEDGGASPSPAPEPRMPEDGNGPPPPAGLGEALEGRGAGNGRWIEVNNRWVQVEQEQVPTNPRSGPNAQPAAERPSGLPAPEEMVTQRVIEVDAQELMKGAARYNIVIRPNDVVHVPVERRGNIYVGGDIARPGTYSLPGENSLTLKQLIISAGGFSPTAIPERVDLVRRLGPDTEAMVQLNVRAMFEGVQPDIYLKPDDTINVGTNLPATWLAILRNSFRFSYGMGFLLDRNFGTEIIGL